MDERMTANVRAFLATSPRRLAMTGMIRPRSSTCTSLALLFAAAECEAKPVTVDAAHRGVRARIVQPARAPLTRRKP